MTAPAGAGKTLLVTSWLQTRPEVAVAWMSLDPADDDPVRLWTYICEAIATVSRGAARSALESLKGSQPSVQVAIDRLHNSLASLAKPLVLVLDNLDHVRSRTGRQSLIYAIERMPETTRIVGMSAGKWGSEFGGLRGRRKVVEIPSEELNFSMSEAKELLLAAGGIALSEADLAVLMERTEGWATGLTLAAEGLASAPSRGEWIRDFSGADGPVADYLASEVLDKTEAETRRFLVQTSALDEFTASMCDAVFETRISKARLRELQKTNLFLIRLAKSGAWFRYHPLLLDLLREEHERMAPAESTAMRVAAAHWLLQNGHVDEGIAALSAVPDPGRVADLLVHDHMIFIRSGHLNDLMEWVDSLPSTEVASRPILAAAGSLVATLVGRPPARRERLARMAERGAPESPPADASYVLAVVSMTRALTTTFDLGAAIEHAERAVEFSREHFAELAVPALATLASNLYLAGDFARARAVAEEAMARPEAMERPHGLIQAHAVHSITESSAGQIVSGEAEARHALALAKQVGLSEAYSAGLAHQALGYALLLTQHPAEAEREFGRAESLLGAPEPSLLHAQALLSLADVRIARGKLTTAAAELGHALEQLSAFTDAGYLSLLAQDVEGRLIAARDGMQRPPEPPSPAEWAVLRLLATDLSQREIADQLFLSLNTVKTHTANLYQKLGAHSRAEAVTQGRVAGLLNADDEEGEIVVDVQDPLHIPAQERRKPQTP